MKNLLALLGLLILGSCASYPPLPTVSSVDLERFQGDWFVVSHIPAGAEKQAYNGVENYQLREDGKIATTYTFRESSFDGPLEILEPVGRVRNKETNATWGMRFFWFYEAEYLIAHLDEDYQETIIARSARDYAWIMTRDPNPSPERLAELEAKLAEMGYSTDKLRRVPQQWPDGEHPANESALAASR